MIFMSENSHVRVHVQMETSFINPLTPRRTQVFTEISILF